MIFNDRSRDNDFFITQSSLGGYGIADALVFVEDEAHNGKWRGAWCITNYSQIKTIEQWG